MCAAGAWNNLQGADVRCNSGSRHEDEERPQKVDDIVIGCCAASTPRFRGATPN
jgi:hypothetical protein